MRRIGSVSSVIEGTERQPADCPVSCAPCFRRQIFPASALDNVAGELPVFSSGRSFKRGVICVGKETSGPLRIGPRIADPPLPKA